MTVGYESNDLKVRAQLKSQSMYYKHLITENTKNSLTMEILEKELQKESKLTFCPCLPYDSRRLRQIHRDR